jgi:hypothetical protein
MEDSFLDEVDLLIFDDDSVIRNYNLDVLLLLDLETQIKYCCLEASTPEPLNYMKVEYYFLKQNPGLSLVEYKKSCSREGRVDAYKDTPKWLSARREFDMDKGLKRIEMEKWKKENEKDYMLLTNQRALKRKCNINKRSIELYKLGLKEAAIHEVRRVKEDEPQQESLSNKKLKLEEIFSSVKNRMMEAKIQYHIKIGMLMEIEKDIERRESVYSEFEEPNHKSNGK